MLDTVIAPAAITPSVVPAAALPFTVGNHAHDSVHPNATPAAKTLVAAAYQNLRRDIIEGRLAPGSRLRVEHLKNDYGVGAGTLREALALLVSDALVVTQDQRGFHVKPISTTDFYDITQTRILLECEALRQSIAHADEAWEARVVAAFHLLGRVEVKLEREPERYFNEREARNTAFHQALIANCQSNWVKHFWGILYHQAERYRRLTIVRKPMPRDLHAEHQAIFEAALARDSDAACHMLARHIRATWQALEQLPEALQAA